MMNLSVTRATIGAAMRRLILLFLLLPLLAPAADELGQKKAELKALQQQIGDIARQLERDRKEKDSLSQELEKVERRLSGLRQALRTVSTDLASATKTFDAVQQQESGLQDSLKQQYRALESQLRAAYVIGRQARSRMLLSQDDPARLARLQVYLESFQKQHEKQILGFADTLDALSIKREAAHKARTELEQMRRSHEQTLASIEAQRRSRDQALQQLEKRLSTQGASVAALQKRQAELEKLIEGLGQATLRHKYTPSGPFAKNRGKLVPPVQGKLLARFREQKPDGESRWNGLWLAADTGTPVRAIADARVVYVGWMHQLGLLIVLDHGQGYFSLYGHNQSALKTVGDEVRAGDPIAEAGDTGGHRKSGVYLEIRQGRRAIDPKPWLASS